MTTRNGKAVFAMIFLFLAALVIQSCGGGGSSSTVPPPANGPTLSGTAASGAAVASGAITVKDKNGVTKSGTTDANGKYTIDVTGMAAPFLVKVTLSSGAFLYSVGAQTGVVNIHPYTDLIIQTWYKVQGKTIDAAFSDPAGNPPPTATEIKLIANVVGEIVQKWLVDNAIDPATFDLITTSFDANHSGFDHLLDISLVNNGTVTITEGTTTQTTTLTPHTDTNAVSLSTTTTGPGGTSTTASSIVVPTNSAQQAALNGVAAGLNQFKTIVNSKGAVLADTDLIGIFDANYLSDGFDKTIGSAQLASQLRGTTINSFTVDRIISYDDSAKVVTIVGSVSVTQDGTTLTEKFNADDGFVFKLQPDGTSWFIYGNQRPASAGLQVEMRTDIFRNSPTVGPRQSINVDVRAPQNTVSAVRVTGGGIFTNTIVPKSGQPDFETIEKAPGTKIQVPKDAFFYSIDTPFPPAGAVFTITVDLVAGGSKSYTVTTGGTTTEPISITSPTGHTLAEATLGQPLTVHWTLPTTFPVVSVNFGGHVTTSLDPNAGSSCQVDVNVAPTATSGAITFPSTCNGPSVTATINVSTIGPNGERNIIIYEFE